MSKVIEGIYEIEREIGSGGGGVVYLGRHLRLNKNIVLKADKRKLSTKPEALRREVDMLKELSHTYIPQVYDFVEQDGVVYTVMDFVEGESLDKLIKRGELPTQPEVIKWTRELLEALCYLHSRPPYGILHGDIKPANIMLRPNGDICLIDFNIALALGENGAVKVGGSRGYASPELYGIDFVSSGSIKTSQLITAVKKHKDELAEATETWIEQAGETETMGFPETETMVIRPEASSISIARSGTANGSTGGSSGRSVFLDVRSDIYSLGATLYHLLTGRRPAQNAFEVVPLSKEDCSEAMADIINKAMDPIPDLRYQSAQEMLADIEGIYKHDKRVIRHKRRAIISGLFTVALFLSGGMTAFIGLKQMEARQEDLTLAEYSVNSLLEGNKNEAVELALKAIPDRQGLFEPEVTAEAQKALTDALGVYELSDGFKPEDMVELPSAPFKLSVSPEGTRFAAVYENEAAIFSTYDCKLLDKVSMRGSALSDFLFLNEDAVIYSGSDGITALNVADKNVIWTGRTSTVLSLSGDRKRVAAIDHNEDTAVIYDTSTGKKVAERSFKGMYIPSAENDIFADPDNYIFELNDDGSLLAVSFDNGAFRIFDLNNEEGDMYIYDESEYTDFAGGFCGNYFAFVSGKAGQWIFGLIDAKEALYIGGYEQKGRLELDAGEQGIYISSEDLLVRFDEEGLTEQETAYVPGSVLTGFSVGKDYTAVMTEDNRIAFFDKGANLTDQIKLSEGQAFIEFAGDTLLTANRDASAVWVYRAVSHKDAEIWAYDPRDAHDEARISNDGNTVMLFDYEGFRIYDKKGEMISETRLPDPESIYDQQFLKYELKEPPEVSAWGPSVLKVIWYDGTVRKYNAADGSLMSEEKAEKPDETLYEEFMTDDYRIASSLHEAPKVYDSISGKFIKELETDAYLTYVTQAGEYIITEYVTAEGERYGLLLNGRLEKLAYLPGLTDYWDGKLIFDYGSGSLRQSRIYSLQELMEIAAVYKQ